jgi:hypothetical protein
VTTRIPPQADPLRLESPVRLPADGLAEHQLVVWVEERDEDDEAPLVQGEPYTLVAMASVDGPDARYSAEVSTPSGAGLPTTWILSSTTVRLECDPEDPEVECGSAEAGDDLQWMATFPLTIPESGDSARRRIRCTPLAGPEGRIEASVRVRDDPYRHLTVSFEVERAATTAEPVAPAPPVSVLAVGKGSPRHAGLRPAADWQRAARQMRIDVFSPGRAQVVILQGGQETARKLVGWGGGGDVVTRIGPVRKALDVLRQAHPGYFELISPERLAADLDAAVPTPGWDGDTALPEGSFGVEWATVADSDELRDLAFYGHELFTALFADEALRRYLADLTPGDLVQLAWLEETTDRVPHLPLPLLYLDPVSYGTPIDPMRFLGMRHRLGYVRRESPQSRALGDWSHTTRAHLLYWVQDPTDEVAVEAARHAVELRRWAPMRLLPDGEPRIDNLARFLAEPSPSPVALIYFYCHCDAGAGENPYLRFGPTNGAADVLRRPRMGNTTFVDEPVVFVNACGTTDSDPLLVNQLMDGFLDRGCRAYIGTEGRVPPGVAARFATTFFSFLYGTPDRARAPVGEAVAQARRFLWDRYRNLGGLFYTFVNDFLVYAADDADVAALGAAHVDRSDT